MYNMINVVLVYTFYFKLVRARFPPHQMICYSYYSTGHYIKTKKIQKENESCVLYANYVYVFDLQGKRGNIDCHYIHIQ